MDDFAEMDWSYVPTLGRRYALRALGNGGLRIESISGRDRNFPTDQPK